jgi:nicotinamide-nucleotide amidase
MQSKERLKTDLTRIAEFCHAHNLRVACAESCTGGLLAAALSSTPGSSAWFEGGLVTYRLSAKENLLGIPMSVLNNYGAVSQEVARQMVAKTIERTGADIAIATTGLAGPEGDGTSTPVGTLWIACWLPSFGSVDKRCCTQKFELNLPRERFRQTAVNLAIADLAEKLN